VRVFSLIVGPLARRSLRITALRFEVVTRRRSISPDMLGISQVAIKTDCLLVLCTVIDQAVGISLQPSTYDHILQKSSTHIQKTPSSCTSLPQRQAIPIINNHELNLYHKIRFYGVESVKPVLVKLINSVQPNSGSGAIGALRRTRRSPALLCALDCSHPILENRRSMHLATPCGPWQTNT
jgi:hypothetical protein